LLCRTPGHQCSAAWLIKAANKLLCRRTPTVM
jgi:hypothetical protein